MRGALAHLPVLRFRGRETGQHGFRVVHRHPARLDPAPLGRCFPGLAPPGVPHLSRLSFQGGLHFWSLDRDTDCAPGSSSPTCNSYGAAGSFGFTNRFVSDLGL